MTGLSQAANKETVDDKVDQDFTVNYDPSQGENILNEHEGLENEIRTQARPYKDRILAQDKQIAEALGFETTGLQGAAVSLYSKIDEKAFRKVGQQKYKKWADKYNVLRKKISELDRIIEGELIYESAKSIDELRQKKMEMAGGDVGLRYKFELARDESDLYLQLAREAKAGIKESQEKLGLIDGKTKKYQDKDDPASKGAMHDLKQQRRETQRILGRSQTNYVRLEEKARGVYTHAKDLGGELQKKELERNKYLERSTQINVILNYVGERLSEQNPEESIVDNLHDFDKLGKNFGKLRKGIQQRNDIRINGRASYLNGQQNDMYEGIKKEHNAFLTRSLNGLEDLEAKIDSL